MSPSSPVFEQGAAPNWSVAIFASRESIDDIRTTIAAIEAAITQSTVIDILVNGNKFLEDRVIEWLKSRENLLPPSIAYRVWSIPLLNKAHVWNQYIQQIWPYSNTAFFIDGNVRIAAATLDNTMRALNQNLTAMAASSPWSTRMKPDDLAIEPCPGQFLGGFFALRSTTIEELRRRDIRLPLGLYGFDTVLGGFLGYGLAPDKNEWDMDKYVATTSGMRWFLKEKHWWRLTDMRTQFKRMKNNALRVLVQKATIQYLRKSRRQPESLPKTIEMYVKEWAKVDLFGLIHTFATVPLSFFVYLNLKTTRDWSAASQQARLSYSIRER